MTLRIPTKVLLHVWSYDFYDMKLSTGKQRRHMINIFLHLIKSFLVTTTFLTFMQYCNFSVNLEHNNLTTFSGLVHLPNLRVSKGYSVAVYHFCKYT